MRNAFEVLEERGFIQQMTHPERIKELLANEKVSFYIGFDPTADSLHIGHFMTVMAMAHMQRAGHRPIVLVGGGTGMVGDPTDKTDMRKVMTREEVSHNVNCFKAQLSKFIDFDDDKAIMADNADWLLELNYVKFIREVGVHFTVNRMLAADCYKTRYEKGLSFLEFNYMIMQSYDFLELSRLHDCRLQLGGNDQWSNIIGGVELIRRADNKEAFGMTFTLLTTSEGKKMGKTEAGAVWLDPNKTTPFEFFQYWRNVDDKDVKTCLSLLTFLPMEQVIELSSLEGSEINKAKEILAFELTKIVHNEEEATKALESARALFSGGTNLDNIATSEISTSEIENGLSFVDLVERIGLVSSKGEGRRLIQQNGFSINSIKISDVNYSLSKEDFDNNSMMIQKGKKIFHKIMLI